MRLTRQTSTESPLLVVSRRVGITGEAITVSEAHPLRGALPSVAPSFLTATAGIPETVDAHTPIGRPASRAAIGQLERCTGCGWWLMVRRGKPNASYHTPSCPRCGAQEWNVGPATRPKAPIGHFGRGASVSRSPAAHLLSPRACLAPVGQLQSALPVKRPEVRTARLALPTPPRGCRHLRLSPAVVLNAVTEPWEAHGKI